LRKKDEYEFMVVTQKVDSDGDGDSGSRWRVVGVPAGETFYQSEGE
jgi:hypothetical protein